MACPERSVNYVQGTSQAPEAIAPVEQTHRREEMATISSVNSIQSMRHRHRANVHILFYF